jgi:hypothetical protein
VVHGAGLTDFISSLPMMADFLGLSGSFLRRFPGSKIAAKKRKKRKRIPIPLLFLRLLCLSCGSFATGLFAFACSDFA